MRILKMAVAGLALLVVAGLAWLVVAPPDLIRVGANYSAKMVCSNLFLAGRDPDEVLAVDVQAPGHPLLRLMRVDTDESEGTVRTGLFGIAGGGLAVHTNGRGCAVHPDGRMERLSAVQTAADAPAQTWPVAAPDENPDIEAILNDEALTGPGLRAVVVAHEGTIIGETYGEGFGAETPLLGWSMTKTVMGALVGLAIKQDLVALDEAPDFEAWDTDAREAIALADMMGMAPDLAWNESYGSVTDVTRMLFLESDMAAFAASKPRDETNDGGVGEVFNYSSGTTVLISRLLADAHGSGDALLDAAYRDLFAPLGMTSAVLETDAAGTPIGSSYMYATARDWARFGQLLLQRGVWNERSLLPVGFVDWMSEAHPASDGQYGSGQVWLRAPNSTLPGDNADLPDDAFFMSGHDGQMVAIVPSADLVVVRLGLTPTSEGYKPGFLVEAVLAALEAGQDGG